MFEKKLLVSNKYKRNIYLILLFSLVAFHLINNLYLLRIQPLAEGKDSYTHVMNFLNFSQIAKYGEDNPFYIPHKSRLYNMIFVSLDYPPFFYGIAFLVNFFLGAIFLNAALFTSTLFFVLLIIGVYNIGGIIDKPTGVLAAFICSFYPILFISSRHFNLELALSAMVSLSVWILLKTELFKKRIVSILLGLSLGLGMLTKQTFFIYMLGPLVIVLIFVFFQAKRRAGHRQTINIIFCFFTAFFLSLIFYFNKQIYISALDRMRFIGAVNNPNIFSQQHLLYLPKSLIHTVGTFFTALLCFALIFLRRIKIYLRCLLLTWVVIPIVILSFFLLKYAEYTMAFLPALALITAAGIKNIKNNQLRILVVAMLMGISLYTFLDISYLKGDFFYASYYPGNNSSDSVLLKQTSRRGDKISSAVELIKNLGGKSNVIGIFYDDLNYRFPAYFLRGIFSWSSKKARTVDFISSTTSFLNHLDNFNIMIFVSRGNAEWVDSINLEKFIAKVNRKNQCKIRVLNDLRKNYVYADRNGVEISKDIVNKLINSREKFALSHKIKFFDNQANYSEWVYVYERIL